MFKRVYEVSYKGTGLKAYCAAKGIFQALAEYPDADKIIPYRNRKIVTTIEEWLTKNIY